MRNVIMALAIYLYPFLRWFVVYGYLFWHWFFRSHTAHHPTYGLILIHCDYGVAFTCFDLPPYWWLLVDLLPRLRWLVDCCCYLIYVWLCYVRWFAIVVGLDACIRSLTFAHTHTRCYSISLFPPYDYRSCYRLTHFTCSHCWLLVVTFVPVPAFPVDLPAFDSPYDALGLPRVAPPLRSPRLFFAPRVGVPCDVRCGLLVVTAHVPCPLPVPVWFEHAPIHATHTPFHPATALLILLLRYRTLFYLLLVDLIYVYVADSLRYHTTHIATTLIITLFFPRIYLCGGYCQFTFGWLLTLPHILRLLLVVTLFV